MCALRIYVKFNFAEKLLVLIAYIYFEVSFCEKLLSPK